MHGSEREGADGGYDGRTIELKRWDSVPEYVEWSLGTRSFGVCVLVVSGGRH